MFLRKKRSKLRMRCLITGANGFVGKVLCHELADEYSEIYGLALHSADRRDIHLVVGDVRNQSQIDSILNIIQPDVIYHLAAQPFVPQAIQNPQETLDINVKGTLNLLQSLNNLKKNVKFIYISSADVYGKQENSSLPFSEGILPNPLNPYSASKLAAEVYCRQFAQFSSNMKIMIVRPFNHIGVGQKEEFVVPNFFRQLLRESPESEDIMVGDLSSSRDFLDVRDVVKAYKRIDQKGESGEVYNICSGEEVRISDLLNKIIKVCKSKKKIKVDPSRLRGKETSRLFGSNEKIKSLGWKREYSLDQSLLEIYKSLV